MKPAIVNFKAEDCCNHQISLLNVAPLFNVSDKVITTAYHMAPSCGQKYSLLSVLYGHFIAWSVMFEITSNVHLWKFRNNKNVPLQWKYKFSLFHMNGVKCLHI